MGRFRHLKIRQVNSALAPFREIPEVDRPGTGWIKAIREAYGMSIRQLAERIGISKTAAATLERNEAAQTTLRSTGPSGRGDPTRSRRSGRSAPPSNTQTSITPLVLSRDVY